jgi:hypothetical protein
MKADLRVSINDHPRKRNPKSRLFRPPYPRRQFLVQMNGEAWPMGGEPVSLTRTLAALRQALVRAGCGGKDWAGSHSHGDLRKFRGLGQGLLSGLFQARPARGVGPPLSRPISSQWRRRPRLRVLTASRRQYPRNVEARRPRRLAGEDACATVNRPAPWAGAFVRSNRSADFPVRSNTELLARCEKRRGRICLRSLLRTGKSALRLQCIQPQ